MQNIKAINSLRGYAVLAVILFHLNQEIFINGFIGVDIFFVLSGFLIAKVVANYSKDRKNFFKFYFKKRIQRIFPGLIVLCLSSLLFGFFILSPNHYNELQEQILFSLLGISNFYFYFNTNYFDTENIYRPLLHLWTIGLEIQFYILYPFLFLLIYKIFTKPKTGILIIFLIFFGANILNYNLNNEYERSSFYLNLRFSEFFVGTIFFYYKEFLNRIIPVFFLYISYFLLVFSQLDILKFDLHYFNIQIIFINIAVGIIIIKQEHTKDLVKFNNFIINYLGKISYSLYLFHLPIIIFYKYIVIRDLLLKDYIILFLFTIIISSLSYYFIEKTFYDFKK